MSDCSSWNLICKGLSSTAQSVQDSIVNTWAADVMDSMDKALRQLGTFWVKVPTPDVGSQGSVVSWAQGVTGWIPVYIATGCLIAAGINMAITQRGEDLRKIARGMFLLVIVSVTAMGVAQMLIDIADGTSSAILSAATDTTSDNFMMKILTISNFDMGSAGLITVILMGLIGVLANLLQIGMMFVRSAMLILMVSIMPIVAAAAISDWGRAWLKKLLSWFLAFVLMKPISALIYAIAIKLVEGNSYDITDDGELNKFILGVMMMVLAAFALPALVSFLVPIAGALGSGGSTGAVLAAAGATGAMAVDAVARHGASGNGGGAPVVSSNTGGDGPSGADGVPGSSGRDGAGTDGTDGAEGATGSAGGPGGRGTRGGAGTPGTTGGDGAGMPGATGSTGSAGAPGSTGGAGTGASGAAGAAGAAGGAVVVAQAGAKAVQVASDTANDAASEGASGAGEVSR